MNLLFLAPFSWGTQKREAAAPKARGCFMGGTCAVRKEPGKQKPRSCRAQKLARSSAQKNERQKKGHLPDPVRIEMQSKLSLAARAGNILEGQTPFEAEESKRTGHDYHFWRSKTLT